MNKEHDKQIETIKKEFKDSNRILNAICDENRQMILVVLMDNCTKGGIQVKDIAKKINLSRPAVSHHLKILKDEGFVKIEKSGTKNFYHITGIKEVIKLKALLNSIEEFINKELE